MRSGATTVCRLWCKESSGSWFAFCEQQCKLGAFIRKNSQGSEILIWEHKPWHWMRLDRWVLFRTRSLGLGIPWLLTGSSAALQICRQLALFDSFRTQPRTPSRYLFCSARWLIGVRCCSCKWVNTARCCLCFVCKKWRILGTAGVE